MRKQKSVLADCFVFPWLWMGGTPIKPQTSDMKWQLAFGEGGLWSDVRCGKEDIMKTRGILIVVSGFAGSGKGTLMNEIMKQYDNYALSISATTRKPRGTEVDGREYFFKTTEEFEKMIAQGELIEYANYVGNYYGTPKAYVEEQLAAGMDVILEIEIQGALKVKKQFPQTLLLFVTPPNATVLKERLVGRGTETAEVIQQRMSRAAEEAEGISAYDYILINDDLQTCVEQMHNIIQSEHYSTQRNEAFISQITEELKGNAKGE